MGERRTQQLTMCSCCKSHGEDFDLGFPNHFLGSCTKHSFHAACAKAASGRLQNQNVCPACVCDSSAVDWVTVLESWVPSVGTQDHYEAEQCSPCGRILCGKVCKHREECRHCHHESHFPIANPKKDLNP